MAIVSGKSFWATLYKPYNKFDEARLKYSLDLALDFFEVFDLAFGLAFGFGLTSSRLVTASVSFAKRSKALAFLSAVAEYLAWFTALRQSLRIESFIVDDIKLI